MNIRALQNIAKWGSLKTSELTPDKLAEILIELGFPIDANNEVLGKVSDALVNNDIDTLADLFNKPAVFGQIATLVSKPPTAVEREYVRVCPHCGEVLFFKVKI